MKSFRVMTVIVCLSLGLAAAAKDKKDDKPAPPDATKVERILKAQRDLALAIVDAEPKNFLVQEKKDSLRDAVDDVKKDVDQSKWRLNFETFDWDPVPPEPPAPPAPAPPPAKK